MRPIIVISTNEQDEDEGTMYMSVTDAATALGRHVSTVHRALTGDRGVDQVAEHTVVDLAMGIQDTGLQLALDEDMYEIV